MPILKPSRSNPGLMDAVDDAGVIVATGYLQVDHLPEGGGQITGSISFVTVGDATEAQPVGADVETLKRVSGGSI